MFRVKSESELRKLGLRLDAADPTRVIPLTGQPALIPTAAILPTVLAQIPEEGIWKPPPEQPVAAPLAGCRR